MKKAIIRKSGSSYVVRVLTIGNDVDEDSTGYASIADAYKYADTLGAQIIPDGDVVARELQIAFEAGLLT